MENTLENKAKFFAQYLGQNVRFWTLNGPSILSKVSHTHMTKAILDSCTLELKPLSSISDEDAIGLARIRFGEDVEVYEIKRTNDGIIYNYCSPSSAVDRNYGIFPRRLYQEECDYLRFKGYALPWMVLSVEKQIEYSWVKLKESEVGNEKMY